MGSRAPSLIHWHGLTPPWQQDGVPGVSGPPIPPGGSADYDFPLRFGGTFWMHSHQGLQEQLLMSAPLIIRDQRDRLDQQEVVVMFADFSFTPPEEIFATLKKQSLAGMGGPNGAASPVQMPKQPAGAPDRNDVKYDAFLANDRTLADPEVVAVETGGRVLLRLINSSAMSAYHIDLGQLEGELIEVDGFQITPVKGRKFPLAVAQRLDISVIMPRESGAHPVLALLEGARQQTGIVLRAGNTPIGRMPEIAESPSPALTLDLESRLRAREPLTPRKADRVHTLNLTGEMAGYIWSINNVVWNNDVPPLPIAKGERVELVLINRTQMPHPMHLHGHEFQVVEIDGTRLPGAVRDTILVPSNRRVVIAFDAVAKGSRRAKRRYPHVSFGCYGQLWGCADGNFSDWRRCSQSSKHFAGRDYRNRFHRCRRYYQAGRVHHGQRHSGEHLDNGHHRGCSWLRLLRYRHHSGVG